MSLVPLTESRSCLSRCALSGRVLGALFQKTPPLAIDTIRGYRSALSSRADGGLVTCKICVLPLCLMGAKLTYIAARKQYPTYYFIHLPIVVTNIISSNCSGWINPPMSSVANSYISRDNALANLACMSLDVVNDTTLCTDMWMHLLLACE